MMNYETLGPVPAEEECVQVGAEEYDLASRFECARFIQLLRKTIGPEPAGARLLIRSFAHDFGQYREVVCLYDDEQPDAVAYALRCVNEAPTRWEPAN